MDDVSIQVNSGNTENASLIAGFIGDSLQSAGFVNVNVQQSIISEDTGSYLEIIKRDFSRTLYV
jgi:hypothetical protein